MPRRFDTLDTTLGRSFPQLDLARLPVVQKVWLSVADPALARHTELVVLHGGVVLVFATSPVWANKVRHIQSAMLTALSAADIPVNEFRVRVRTDASPPDDTPKRPPLRLSPESARLLADTAKHIKSARLRDSLMRLCRIVQASE